jgi:arabinofuranosyltransferase
VAATVSAPGAVPRESDAPAQGSSWPVTLATIALLALPLVVLAIGAWQYRWMSDDGFINLRIVSEIKAGHGPVFNPGERVEASTSPLWVGVLVLADLVLPLRLEWVAVIVGIALTLLGVGLSIFGSTRLLPAADRPRVWVPAGALMLAALAPMWKFSSSGLENGLTFAWLGACFAILAVWTRSQHRLNVWWAVVLGLGPLVRPELGIFTLVFLIVVLAGQWRHDRWTRRVAFVGIALALPVAYQLFRMGYYASLVPNSAMAKEAGRPYWSSGWRYLREAVGPYELWIPLVILGAAAYLPLFLTLKRSRRTRATLVVAGLVVAALVDAIYIIRVGGDFMQARLLLPALFALAAPVAVVPLRKEFAGALLLVPWALISLVALRAGIADAPAPFGPGTLNAVTTNDLGFAPGGASVDWFDGHGIYFISHKVPGAIPSVHDPALATYGVGISSYALGPDTYILDLLGLGDAFTSHLKLGRRGVVAHEKPLPIPWIPARLTTPASKVTADDFKLPAFFLARPLDRPGNQTFDARVADAREALTCQRLRDFMDTYTGHLDVSRFISNLGDSFTNSTFRIPPEPREAVAKYCRR